MAGPVRISILANASQARRELDSIANHSSTLGSKFAKFGRVAAAGLAIVGAAAIKVGADSIKAASDLNETVSKTEAVFGKNAQGIIKWADGAATAIGMSKNEALTGASTFGNFFDQIGIGGKQATEMSKRWVTMAADLGSFHNAAPTEVMDALAAATRGEYDSLQKFIPTINAAAVEQKALAMTGKTTAKELTNAEKAAATYQLTLQGQGKAAGDFNRTSGSMANQQKILASQFENLKARIGTALLPIMVKLLGFINNNLIPAFTAMANFLRPIIARVQEFFSSLGGGQSRLQPVVSFIQGTLIPAVQSIIAAFQGLLAVVMPIVQQIVAAILAQWGKLQPQVQAIWTSVKNIIKSALAIIKSVIQIATSVIRAVWQKFGGHILNYITTTMKNMATIVRGVFKVIEGIFKVVSSALKGDWKGMWTGIKQILSGALGIIKGLISQAWNVLKTLTSAAWTAVKTLVGKAWDGIKSAVVNGITKMMGEVRAIPGKITGALSGLGSLLTNAGRDIIQGLIDGITEMAGALKDKLGEITNLIPDWKGPPAKDKRLLRGAGRLIIQGLIEGFKDGESGVEKTLGKLTDFIKKTLDKRYDGKALKRHVARVMKSLKDEYKALQKNGKAQERINEKLKAARAALKDIRNQHKDYAKSVSASAIGYASITNLDTAFNSDAMAAALKVRLEKLKQFADLIKQLKQSGLNQTTLDQLIQGGVEGGMAYALALAQGGDAAVQEINDLQSQIGTVADGLGQTAANNMFNAGVQAAEGLVQGLEAQAKRLDKVAERLAKQLIRAIKKALGIKSPSKAFEEIGRQTLEGLQIGLDETYVKRAGATLASSLQEGFSKPQLSAQAAYAGSTTRPSQPPTTVTVRLTAEQLSAVQRGKAIQLDLDAYARAGGRRVS